MADEVDDMDDLVEKAKAEGKMNKEDKVIDAATKLGLEKDLDKKIVKRKDVFNEIKDVDKYFSNGFYSFLVMYKPVSLNDLYDKLEGFSKIQES